LKRISLFISYSLPLVITASEEEKRKMPLCCKCGTDKRRSEFSCTQFKHPASRRTCKTCTVKFPNKSQVVQQKREESSEPYPTKDKAWTIPWYCGECIDDDFPCNTCYAIQGEMDKFLEDRNKKNVEIEKNRVI